MIKFSKNIKLYKYQEEGRRWLSSKFLEGSSLLLADDMGLGKTLQIIAFLVDHFNSNKIQNALIIVPNSLLANWENEFKKFTTGVDVYRHWGDRRHGMPIQIQQKKVTLSTYNTITQDATLFENLEFDVVILDEASLIKNPLSERTAAIKSLNRRFSIAMTGTPFENSAIDLWSVTDFLTQNFLGDLGYFKSIYGNISELNNSKIEQLEKLISPIMLRRKKEDVLKDLPVKNDIFTPITMTQEERKKYNSLENEIKENLEDQEIALKLISELRKFTCHPLHYSNLLEGSTFQELRKASNKFSHLCSIIENTNKNEKILVFENYILPIDIFSKLIGEYYNIPTYKIHGGVPSSERQAVIDDFSQKISKSILFLNPKTAGMGLNIVAANHVVHYSRQWNPALEQQATARAYRNGQDKSVFVYYLYYEESIESRIHERLKLKEDVSETLVQTTPSEDVCEFILNTYKAS